MLDSFNLVFFDPQRGIYTDGEGSRHCSLHANMFPLVFGMVPEDRKAKVADFVQSRGMACSVYGAQYLLEAMFLCGRDRYAVELMTSHDRRSWWRMIEQGSTMTTEAWDPQFKPNLTWNHAWGAAPANVLSRFVLGVRPVERGYSSLLIAPRPGGLKWARGKVPTPHGPVAASWQAEPPGLDVTVPPGTAAQVELPASWAGDAGPAGAAGAPGAGRTVWVDGTPAVVVGAPKQQGAARTTVLQLADLLKPGRHTVRFAAPDGKPSSRASD